VRFLASSGVVVPVRAGGKRTLGGQGRQSRRSPDTPPESPGPDRAAPGRAGACGASPGRARARASPGRGPQPTPAGWPGPWGDTPLAPRRAGFRCRRCGADWGPGSAAGTRRPWSRWTVAVPGDLAPAAGRGQGKSSNFPVQKVPRPCGRSRGGRTRALPPWPRAVPSALPASGPRRSEPTGGLSPWRRDERIAGAAGTANRPQLGTVTWPPPDTLPGPRTTVLSLSATRPIDSRMRATGTKPSWPCVLQAENLDGLACLKAQTDLVLRATRLKRPSSLCATGLERRRHGRFRGFRPSSTLG